MKDRTIQIYASGILAILFLLAIAATLILNGCAPVCSEGQLTRTHCRTVIRYERVGRYSGHMTRVDHTQCSYQCTSW